jgi:hypothetical protein
MEDDILIEFRSERLSLLKEIEEELLPAYHYALSTDIDLRLLSRAIQERNIILQKREEILEDLWALNTILR